MSQTIGAVHTALAGIVDDLAITSPTTMAMRKVWPYPPAIRTAIDPPSIILTHNLTSVAFQPGGAVEQQYEMRLQLFAAPAEVQADTGAAIANAFLDALVTALSAHVRMGGAVQVIRGFRGSSGATLGILEWAGAAFVGIDVTIPITLLDTRERGA